jgi:hypothetical protein
MLPGIAIAAGHPIVQGLVKPVPILPVFMVFISPMIFIMVSIMRNMRLNISVPASLRAVPGVCSMVASKTRAIILFIFCMLHDKLDMEILLY